jgi:hypothetical protein
VVDCPDHVNVLQGCVPAGEEGGVEVEGGRGLVRTVVPLRRQPPADVADQLKGQLAVAHPNLLQALQLFFEHFDVRGATNTMTNIWGLSDIAFSRHVHKHCNSHCPKLRRFADPVRIL